MNYLELKAKHEAELNAFPMAFAFNKAQLETGLAKLNITRAEASPIPGGGFIRKSDKQAFLSLLDKHRAERDQALKNDDFVIEAIEYELSNHEFCITHNPQPALSAVGVSLSGDSLSGDRIPRLYEIARKRYLANASY